MAQAANEELLELFEELYDQHYQPQIAELARQFPEDSKSLRLDLGALRKQRPAFVDDFISNPDLFQEVAEETLRVYDTAEDVSLGQAHVRLHGLTTNTSIEGFDSGQLNTLVNVEGLVRSATDVEPRLERGVFVCLRCGGETEVPQGTVGYEEPERCISCDREGPFKLDPSKSEFVDFQTLTIIDSPNSLSEGEAPGQIDVHFEDDEAGAAAAGEYVTVTGVLRLNTDESDNDTPVFSTYIEGSSVIANEENQPPAGEDNAQPVTDLETYRKRATEGLTTLPAGAREEETKAKLITPFVAGLGWNKFDSEEVRLEYSDSKTDLRPDYALFGPESSSPDVIIEAKQTNVNLETKESQLYDYLRIFSADWGVLTNGEEFWVYEYTDGGSLPEKRAEIPLSDLPSADVVDSLRRSAYYEDR